MNILSSLPTDLTNEVFEDLITGGQFRLERIVSKGQCLAPDFWYDQDEHEWVVVLEGSARLIIEKNDSDDGQFEQEITLNKGDSLNIPAHTRHKVSWTLPHKPTIWLAVFYS